MFEVQDDEDLQTDAMVNSRNDENAGVEKARVHLRRHIPWLS